ncbi:MAG TPA: MraY family glycosyltransferase [Terracidiphilus sp.]|nr:MraY family glycosyltransferase [Terracidiphilus sp.]
MHTITLLLVGATAFLLALVLTPLVRKMALRHNLVDSPDCSRKIHRSPTPRVGGVAVMLAYAGSQLLALALSGCHGLGIQLPMATVATILPGATIVFFAGLADDLVNLSPLQKLGLQVVAAVVVVSHGLTIHIGDAAGARLLGAALTVLWIVGCTNAVNLIDGLDGLAAGVALVAALTTLAAALLTSHIGLALAIVSLIGALIGFLRYNFNPASIFLGDSGSLTIGFLLGSCTVIWSAKSATVAGCAAPVLALAIPLTDVGLAFVRRFLRRDPVFAADRGHIHHRLLARGIHVRSAALLLYAAACGFSVLALLFWRASGLWSGVVLMVFAAAVALGVRYLGYAELGAAYRVLFALGFRRVVKTQLSLDAFQLTLRSARTPGEAWRAICDAYPKFGFAGAEMEIGGVLYSDGAKLFMQKNVWQAQIPLADHDYVTLERARDPRAAIISEAFVDAVQSILVEKCSGWQPQPVLGITLARISSAPVAAAAANRPRTAARARHVTA